MNRINRRLLALAIAVAISGCASQGPAVHLHSLMPADVPPRAKDAQTVGLPVVIDVRLPARVDQPQWLISLPDGSLQSLEQERWAAPLHDEIRQSLLEQLAPSSIVDAALISGAKPVRVVVDYRRFDSIPGVEARIEGAWTVSSAAGVTPVARCQWLYREPATSAMQSLAAAHRKATARLADALAREIVAASSNQPLACPGTDLR